MKRSVAILLVLVTVLLCGCGYVPVLGTDPMGSTLPATNGSTGATEPASKPTSGETEPSAPATQPSQPQTEPPQPQTEPSQPQTEPSQPQTEPPQPQTEPSKPQMEPTEPEQKRLIVIDAGHQGKGNKAQEPVGPGAEELKTKVAAGTSGCVSGWNEYELNLAVSLLLQAELERRGYEVLMIRTTNDVDISNAERAQYANAVGADALIRIHANGSDDPAVHGALTICQTADNPYQPQLYGTNRQLADCVIQAFSEATGCQNRGVWETDTMTGINWCEVPNCIVEMGFMSNPEEDALMATESYQALMVQGIADGIDHYFDGIS